MLDDPAKPLSQQEKDLDLPLAEGVEDDGEPTDEELDKIAHEEPDDILVEKQLPGSMEPNGVDVGLGIPINIVSNSLEEETKEANPSRDEAS